MLSVPEGMRSKNKFDTLVATQKLACYTVEICSNKNAFWNRPIAEDISATAWRAHSRLTKANMVNVRPGCDPANILLRRTLQEEGIMELRTLQKHIEAAALAFHRDKRKTTYWAGLCIDAIDLATNWRDSEARKYRL